MRSLVLSALGGLALVSAQSTVVSGDYPQQTVVTGKLGDAEVVSDNPVGVSYIATLPESTKSTIRGYISGTSNEDGVGVRYDIHFTGFPDLSLAPYIYHIHDQPIPSNGNCTAALAHQDPYIRGEQPPCNASAPETCQTGDLSGKYGNITTRDYSTSYVDLYTSTKPGLGSFFGNRSIVLHAFNTTRLTCANFTLVTNNNNQTNSSSYTPSPTSPGSMTPPPAATGGAATTGASLVALVAGMAAAAFLM